MMTPLQRDAIASIKMTSPIQKAAPTTGFGAWFPEPMPLPPEPVFAMDDEGRIVDDAVSQQSILAMPSGAVANRSGPYDFFRNPSPMDRLGKEEVLTVKYSALRDNPVRAQRVFDFLHRNTMEFSPVKNFMLQIEDNPNIKVPDSYKQTSTNYRPAIKLNDDGETFRVDYERLAPDKLAPNGHSEDVEKWLNEALFVDVYNELFGTDIKDAILHQKSYQLYRWVGLGLGITEWALTAAPLLFASAEVFAAAGEEGMPSIEDIITRPTVALMLGLSALTAAVSSTGSHNAPVAQTVRAISWLVERALRGKVADLASTIGDFFRRDPTNYFANKHLATKDKFLKYLKILLTRGNTGLIWELYKDYPEQYKAYRILTKGFNFLKSTAAASANTFVQKVGSFAPGIAKYLPSTNGHLIGGALQFGWLLPWAMVPLVLQNPSPDAGEIAGALVSTAMIAGASTVFKTQFDTVKKQNLMEALVYDQLNALNVMAASYLYANVPFFQSLPVYAAELSLSTLLIIGVGKLIRNSAQKAETAAASESEPKTA